MTNFSLLIFWLIDRLAILWYMEEYKHSKLLCVVRLEETKPNKYQSPRNTFSTHCFSASDKIGGGGASL